MAPGRDAQGSGTEPAAATVRFFILMPLVKLAALRAAGLDREAAGSPGFCFPRASPGPQRCPARALHWLQKGEGWRGRAGGCTGERDPRAPQEEVPFSSKSHPL